MIPDCPIGHTCPSIDDVLEDIGEIADSLKQVQNLDLEESKEIREQVLDHINDAAYFLARIPNKMENLRGDNSELRSWGEECAEGWRATEEERDQMEEQRNVLESRIEELEV